jgi:two-component system chemotaxis sensor kinase CheA
VTLAAWQRGSHVIIEVRDDGAGIHLKRVREVAVERGVLTPEKARELNERELHALLFLPGFSTAGKVSTLSGRGVGLDVVKVNIAKLSGIIDVSSSPDGGTAFRLTLPVTLAIVRALVIQVSQRVYAVPLSSVLEIVSITPADIRTVERRQIVSVRGQTLPLIWLAELFGHEQSHAPRPFVVVVGLAQERVGLVVDELLGQQDIVTKPLGGRLKNVRGISGATDIGSRRTVLVLDVGALLEEV